MRILFLEDDPTIREVLTEYMKMQDYQVVPVDSGDDAIALLEKERFDMAVLDIMVPGAKGLDVLLFIKENSPDTATIMLTAMGDEKTQLEAFNLYTDDYVVKPVSPLILLKRMETILRRVKREDMSSEKGLVLHEDSYQTFYDGSPLYLWFVSAPFCGCESSKTGGVVLPFALFVSDCCLSFDNGSCHCQFDSSI